ncbi:MAG TPA: SDR family NAD(P)-dependent oxidoreductase [Candidatus Angelobacter sp.]|nr:SDR family NAD(P)-dependent oxidoreductase [Candidatus Angelobacter sp.]
MKTVIITGANSGIGFATAKFIASRSDWHLALACRTEGKANQAVHSIRRAHPQSRVSFAPLELFSLASVRRFPGVLAEMRLPPLAGLILNAGGPNVKAKSPELTEDGFEKTFQLNFLGHFLLANLLVRQMPADGRIIFVSSDLHDPAATWMGRIAGPRYAPLEQLARGTGVAARLKPMVQYATAKMLAMMAAYEFDRRLRIGGKTITVNSWSPGVVPTTVIGKDMNPVLKKLVSQRWFVNFMGSHLSTEEEAGRALGGLLLDSRYSGLSGRYFDGFNETLSSVESRDPNKAKIVWQESSRLLGWREDAEDVAFSSLTSAR